VPNLVEIDQTAAEIWRFFDFSKMAAVLSQQAAAKLPMTLGDIYTFLAAIMSSGEYNANSVDRNASELTLSRQKLV